VKYCSETADDTCDEAATVWLAVKTLRISRVIGIVKKSNVFFLRILLAYIRSFTLRVKVWTALILIRRKYHKVAEVEVSAPDNTCHKRRTIV
jgi:hypothetical protein